MSKNLLGLLSMIFIIGCATATSILRKGRYPRPTSGRPEASPSVTSPRTKSGVTGACVRRGASCRAPIPHLH